MPVCLETEEVVKGGELIDQRDLDMRKAMPRDVVLGGYMFRNLRRSQSLPAVLRQVEYCQDGQSWQN